VSEAGIPRSAVLCWPAESSGPQPVLSSLWQRVAELGWLPVATPRIVIQIGQAWRSPIVEETARSLIEFLGNHVDVAIDVLDAAAAGDRWGRARVRNVAAEDTLDLSADAMRGALTVPRLWFESFSLVTITGAGPSAASRISCVLDAQADPLRRLGNPPVREALIYEAHRLAGSDLAVACGHVGKDDPASRRWWAVSASDVAVDQAVASEAGIEQPDVRDVRALARHELVAPPPEMLGNLPRLRGHAAPPWQMRVAAVRTTALACRHVLSHDLAMLRSNLHRVPGFLRRRRARASQKQTAP
jgi:hypothetical protein